MKENEEFNPFLLHGYESKEYFCDRTTELTHIKEAMSNQRHLRLVSQRRMGKSSLIHHFFSNQRKFTTIFVDIFRTTNQEELLLTLTEEIVNQLGKPSTSLIKRLSTALTSVSLSMSFDAITGAPSIGASYRPGAGPAMAIKQLFALLESNKKPVVVAIDEFQNIADYPEKNTEALLRQHIQKARNVTFIFSGSNTRMMQSMFTAHKRPFYQSTEPLHLGYISQDEYTAFIRHHFSAAGYDISEEVISDGLSWCRRHTYYVQTLFNKLYVYPEAAQHMAGYMRIKESLLEVRRVDFISLLRLLSPNQAKLLIAIAKEVYAKTPTSIDFIMRHGLSAVSTVRQSLGVLIDKELVHQEEEGYVVTDVFLSRWLAIEK